MSRRIIGKKIGFVGSSFTFCKPIIDYYAKTNMVRAWEYSDEADRRELRFLLDWADIVWCEWGDVIFSQLSQMVDEKSNIVCRIHSWEAFQDFHVNVKWSNVRRLIFVAEHVQSRYIENLKKIEKVIVPKSAVVPNGIDPDKFPFKADGHDLDKIAMIGYMNYKKGPQMAVSVIERIRRDYPSAKLVIVGTSQDPRCDQYIKAMSETLNLDIEFREWVDDTSVILNECGLVLSTSMWESFQYSVAEGVLSGCFPLVHKWRGAETIYPSSCLFSTVDQAAELYGQIRKMSDSDRRKVLQENRKAIVERYNWDDQFKKLDEVMAGAIADGVRRRKPKRNKEVVSGVQEDASVQSSCVPA